MADFNEIFNVVTHFAADTIAQHGEISPIFVFVVLEKELTFRLVVVETETPDMTPETDKIMKMFADLDPVAAFHVFEDVSDKQGRVLIIFGCSGNTKKSTVTPLNKKEDGVVQFNYPIEANTFEHDILDKFDFKLDK